MAFGFVVLLYHLERVNSNGSYVWIFVGVVIYLPVGGVGILYDLLVWGMTHEGFATDHLERCFYEFWDGYFLNDKNF